MKKESCDRLKIIIYGVGRVFYKDFSFLVDVYNNCEIVAIADKEFEKKKLIEPFEEIPVISPKEVKKMEFDGLYITSNKYADEIKNELIAIGIEEKKIWDRMHLKLLLLRDKKIVYGKQFINLNADKRVIILTTDMGLSGGILVSVYAAKALKEKGVDVLLVTPSITKKMLNRVLDFELPVLVKPALPYMFPEDCEWFNPYDYVIVSVFQMINCAKYIGERKPLMWWIHEPKSKWTDYYESTLEKYPDCAFGEWMHNIKIMAVSDIAKSGFDSYFPNIIKECLPFGIPDENKMNEIQPIKQRLKIAVIAGYGEIKGHDVLFSAIKKLPEKTRKQISLMLIGIGGDSEKEIREKVADSCDLEIIGVVNQDTICTLFNNIDVVVCPSYIETMSMTIIEGMMYGKICITTDNTGVAKYFNERNGYIVPVGNENELSNVIKKIVNNKDKLQNMQIEARRTYQERFSLDVFGSKLLAIINE